MKTLSAVLLFWLITAAAIACPAQTLTTVVSFNGTNGADPLSSLVQGVDGNFYGAIFSGGDNPNCVPDGCGTVVRVSPHGAVTRLYSFCSQPNCSDGSNPAGNLVQGADGNFYGTTYSGGSGGTVFKITPSGTLTTLYTFCSQANCADGGFPWAGLVQGTDGNFYGTTTIGGAFNDCEYGCGTIFKITPVGVLTTLHSFSNADGASPQGTLVQGNDGDFYGTTLYGGTYCLPGGCGTVFKITPAGALTTLHSFSGYPNEDLLLPEAGLTQAGDGNFYGTTTQGGSDNAGTVFRITPSGNVTVLHSFCSEANCADGREPQSVLVQATDGNLYGTTSGGGNDYSGTVFRITPSGMLTTLYQFCSQPNCADGSLPTGGLLQATDGKFYGTTQSGGSGHCFNGGACGTIFGLNAGLNPFVTTQPTVGEVGTPVTILGTNLTGATNVSFNGTAATFNVVSPSEITSTVPAGATTGVIQVDLPGTSVISNTDFQVIGPMQFIPVTPCRLVDTRQNGQPIQSGTSRNFTIPTLGGCGIPTDAAAYSLNVTVVPHGPLGYLTIWPQGQIRPTVSTMNSPDGRVKANAAVVPASNDAVSVYVTDTADIILDIDGYFTAPGQSTLKFYPLTPCRVADTRSNSYPQGLGGPHLSGRVARDFPVLNNTTCIPPGIDAAAYSFNLTAVPYQGSPLGYLEVWPTGQQPQNPVSTLNNPTATVVANAAIVPAGSNGEITVYPSNDTDLVIDINGYFAGSGANGLSLYPTVPCRVIDTRGIGNGQPFSGTLSPPVNVPNSPCGIPASARGYVFNATVIPSPTLGYLTLWPDGEGRPVVSTLNAPDGWITSNMAIVPNLNGAIDAYAQGTTQLILDISSYFAP